MMIITENIPKSTEDYKYSYQKPGAVCQIVTRWHYNKALTLTITLKIIVIYGEKDDIKTKLHLMLYVKVILLGNGVGL